ncbi:hypothetical protein [Epilithonimonas caeni]|uniref:hypothetical protein n=1 Tax=Epilithonimonas caeni TaxID=365343 RepID=UPI000417DA53|nr:hypothetical protein [Epilithonimonas caeni]
MRYFLIIILSFFISCKGQDKEEKTNQNQKVKTYSAICSGDYSTGEKLSAKDKQWSLNKKEIDDLMKMSTEISENEWHFSYPVIPCNIEVENYSYKGKKYNLSINGGSYISLYDGKETKVLGCDSPECSKYFLKSKENMEESAETPSKSSQEEKKYNIDFNRNGILDLLTVKKNNSDVVLEIEEDNKPLFTKYFNCDSFEIETNVRYNQAFNIKLEYTNQYQKVFKKVVIPVFYKGNNLIIEKIFISNFGTSAKTGNEEWINKEISNNTTLEKLDLDEVR